MQFRRTWCTPCVHHLSKQHTLHTRCVRPIYIAQQLHCTYSVNCNFTHNFTVHVHFKLSSHAPVHFTSSVYNYQRCTVHVHFTLSMHTMVNYARAVYTFSAFKGARCTCSVHFECTHRCTDHVQCTMHVHTLILCAPSLYAVRTITSALCTYNVHRKFTHRCTVFIMSKLWFHTLAQVVHS